MNDRISHLDNFISNYTAAYPTEDDNVHLIQCWKIQDCGHCIVSEHNCGWCPYSSTCVPLPKHGNLLSPIHNKHICPMPWQERWELRTSPFGCNCSTTSLLVAMATVASTIVSLIILYLLFKLLQALRRVYRGSQGGWEVKVIEAQDGEHWVERTWVRKTGWLDGMKWFGTQTVREVRGEDVRGDGRNPDEIVIDGERRPLLG